MRITEIKNDILSIREVAANRDLTPISIGGLTRAWDVFNTTILNNDRNPSFDKLLARCTQEETRMMERDKPSNGNEPTAFSTHAKRKNNVGPKRQGQGRKGFKEERNGRCYNCNKFGHYARECPHKKDTPRDDDNNNNCNDFKCNGNQRNNRFNNKGKRNAPAARYGNGRPPKRSTNSGMRNLML